MKLIDCPTCRHQCAKNAKACPNCGRHRPGKDLADWVLQYGIVAVIGIVVFLMAYHKIAGFSAGP